MQTATCRILVAALLFAGALPAQDGLRGHWTGNLEAPGRPIAVEIDLDKTAAGWVGSMAIPALKATEIRLEAITLTLATCTFRIKGDPERPTFTGTLSADGASLSGELTQGGTSIPFKFHRAGTAKVAEIKLSPAVAKGFLGTWQGKLASDQPLDLVLKLENGEGGASAVVVIVNQGGAEIPVATIVQQDEILMLSVKAFGAEYWGELNKDGTELSGRWSQGGKETALKFNKERGEPAKP